MPAASKSKLKGMKPFEIVVMILVDLFLKARLYIQILPTFPGSGLRPFMVTTWKLPSDENPIWGGDVTKNGGLSFICPKLLVGKVIGYIFKTVSSSAN